jgi:hypothetical protein
MLSASHFFSLVQLAIACQIANWCGAQIILDILKSGRKIAFVAVHHK